MIDEVTVRNLPGSAALTDPIYAVSNLGSLSTFAVFQERIVVVAIRRAEYGSVLTQTAKQIAVLVVWILARLQQGAGERFTCQTVERIVGHGCLRVVKPRDASMASVIVSRGRDVYRATVKIVDPTANSLDAVAPRTRFMPFPYKTVDLPIPPRSVLDRFDVAEPQDTRFQSCARLLQALWREQQGLAGGCHRRGDAAPRAMGSRLAPEPARAGMNYLRPDIAKAVRRELAYRERGALMDEARAWENLLSSSALVFNLFAPLKADATLALAVFKAAFAIEAARIDGIWFETSPGRGDDAYIGDHTALDVLIAYTDTDDKSCFVGIEVKYAEDRPGTATPVKPRLLEIARRSKLFLDPEDSALHRPPLRQFFAEHMLCHAMVHERGHFERGMFAVVAPTLNYEMAAVIDSYQTHLDPAHQAALPFRRVSIESIVAAICDAGEIDLARKLDERYLDFSPVYDLIDDWEPHQIK